MLESTNEPVFLHMKVVRLLGHAGSDAEFVYRRYQSDIEATQNAQDPIACKVLASILLSQNDMATQRAAYSDIPQY